MRLRHVAVAVGLVAAAGGGFLAATALLGPDADTAERSLPRARTAPASTPTPSPPRPVRASARVRALARSLPLERRVAQLFLTGFEGTDAGAPIFASLPQRPWGAVVIGPENLLAPEPPAALATQFRYVAANAGVPSPLLVAAGVPGLPVQSGVTSPARAREDARAAAEALAAADVDAVLAPVADLAVPAGPAADTGFSDDAAVVGRVARAAVRGWLQGGVLPAVGHFPGQGAASQDPVDGPSTVGAEPEVAAFAPALRRAPAVVVSNAAYGVYDSVTPAALLPEVVDDLLRRELRFDGVAISDDLAGAAAATGGTIGAAAVEALRAGVDLLQVRDPAQVEAAYAEVLRAARSGDLPAARLREALLRVLALKERAELV